MNLGIYIDTMLDTNKLEKINNFIDLAIEDRLFDDISIFYDNIGHNPFNTKCGMFNSTELWSFNGTLIVMSLESLKTTLNIVNNINVIYYYNWDQNINILDLVINSSRIKNIVCRTEKDQKEIFRLTGKKPIGISDNFQDILEILLRCKDEYKSNNNDVYKAA
jgi:hypothetical protein